jgi:hypothetical protein
VYKVVDIAVSTSNLGTQFDWSEPLLDKSDQNKVGVRQSRTTDNSIGICQQTQKIRTIAKVDQYIFNIFGLQHLHSPPSLLPVLF